MDGNPTNKRRQFDKRLLWSKLGRLPSPFFRRGETVGGGFIVVERDIVTGRLRPAPWPFEISSLKAAVDSAAALQAKHPDKAFSVLQERGCTKQIDIPKAQE